MAKQRAKPAGSDQLGGRPKVFIENIIISVGVLLSFKVFGVHFKVSSRVCQDATATGRLLLLIHSQICSPVAAEMSVGGGADRHWPPGIRLVWQT